MLIRYFAIIFGCLGIGELIVTLTHIPFPSSIGIMAYFKQIGENFLAIFISIIISTVVVIVVTGHVYQFFRKRLK